MTLKRRLGFATVLTLVIVPLIRPAMATVAILTFQLIWNNVEASNFFINDETLKTFPFFLTTLTQQATGAGGGMTIAGAGMSAAAGLILFLPNLVIFIFMQSRVMNTMSHSGIK